MSAWRERGEICAKYLTQGSKVCVVGPVSVKTYTGNDGATRASLEITADEVEFVSGRKPSEETKETTKEQDEFPGYTQIETDELPF